MENLRGNPFFRETTPSLVPFSGPPENHLPLEPQTFLQNNLLVQNPFDQVLESAFSRLNLSTEKDQEFDYHALVGGESLDGSGYRFDYGLARAEQLRNNVVDQGLNMVFNGVTNVGPDVDSWDTFMSCSNHSSNLNESCYLLSSRRHELLNEISTLPSSNQRGLAAAAAGSSSRTRTARSRSKDVMGSSFNNNQTNNSFRRPNWLHESLSFLSIGDLRGRLVFLAKDQYRCRLLQRAIDEASNKEIDMILMEVIDHVGELMLDPFANYVVQQLVDRCSEEQKSQILLVVVKDDFQLVNICLSVHGSRSVQKLLENLTNQQQISLVMSALIPGAVALTKDMNGHRVIVHCLKIFSEDDNKYLLNEVANNCYQIATDKSGCCALQQYVNYSKGEARVRLIQEIIANALHLAEDQYGNYVVQQILGLKEPQVTESLVRRLEGNYASLSCNRYGSNVVEKCLVESVEQQSTRIIMELLSNHLLVDPFGNYVIQSALSVSKGFIHKALLNLVRENYPMMRSHVYGKWVLAWFNKRKPPHI